MLLAIDAGNTRIKYAVFEYDTTIDQGFFDKKDFHENIKKILKNFSKITNLMVASVGSLEKEAFSGLPANINLHFITHETPFPFINEYATPLTLGIDRMVLASGAVFSFPKTNRLVIDAGTCITYDFIDSENRYLGGAISPGIRLRYESLHNFTAKLPLLTKSEPADFIGNSTAASIHSGVVNGLCNEIDGFINQYRERYPNFIIILTGGDAVFLSKRLKNTIFANSNFLLESLNHTFQYKIKK